MRKSAALLAVICALALGLCGCNTAAFNMLLAEMGVETRYLTGLTYLAQGGLGYHSWSQVKIYGVWYHIDPDLEDGISKNGTVIYRYFLKSDESMKNRTIGDSA